MTEPARQRRCHLTGAELMRLNDACIRITEAFGDPPYLVGSVGERSDFRDVDVRTILPDDEFDALFAGRKFLWSLLCLAVSEYLRSATGLPVDYQVQRMTEANEKCPGPRNALGVHGRLYAGGGDATNLNPYAEVRLMSEPKVQCRECGHIAVVDQLEAQAGHEGVLRTRRAVARQEP